MNATPLRLIAAGIATSMLCACTSLQPAPGKPDAAAARAGACHADPVQWAIGQEATQDTMGRVWRESRAGLIRPIALGQPVTKEFRVDRVNVELDAGNRIKRVYCG